MQEKTQPVTQPVREVVGLFHDHDRMQNAINELEVSGFDRREISVLGSEEAVQKRYGAKHVAPEALEDDPTAPRSPKPKHEEIGIAKGALIGGGAYVGVVAALLATGGTAIPAMVTTAAIGGLGGGAVGGLLAKVLGDEYSDFFERQIKSGGLLLWVKTPTREKEEKAQKILKEFDASDVHVHQFSPAADITA